MTQTKVEAPFVENNANFRNLIINGDMRIAQRATAATTITNNSVHYATLDRYAVYEYSDAVLTSEQHTMSAAEQATTGQKYAMELNVTTVDSSIAAGQWAFFTQPVEAQFCQSALYGTSAAKDLTLSFWVKTNKTGTYAVCMDKNDSTRYRLPITYTVDAADTWEKKTINISPTAGSTSLITGANGAITDNNGIGFFIWWVLAAGSDFHGTNNTWVSAEKYTTASQVNWLDSTDNNFHITGIQLEVGSTASDFEHLPFDIQRQRCYRYCQRHPDLDQNVAYAAIGHGWVQSTTAQSIQVAPHTVMRIVPSVSQGGNLRIHSAGGGGDATTAIAVSAQITHSSQLYLATTTDSGSGLTQGEGAFLQLNNDPDAYLLFSAEL